jgi:hypothetical protein
MQNSSRYAAPQVHSPPEPFAGVPGSCLCSGVPQSGTNSFHNQVAFKRPPEPLPSWESRFYQRTK